MPRGSRLLAHALKGAVGIFGVSGIIEATQTLECLGQAGELTGATETYKHLDEEICKLKSSLVVMLSSEPTPEAGQHSADRSSTLRHELGRFVAAHEFA